MKLHKKVALAALSLVVFVAADASLAAPPDHAKGTPPEKFYWVDAIGEPVTYQWSIGSCPDGFQVMMSMTYQGFWMVHQSTPGKDQWEFYHSAVPTKIWNADDPSYYVDGVPGTGINRHWTGAGFDSDPIETGVQVMFTLPGYGSIFAWVGRIRIDWNTGGIEFLAGQWDWNPDFQALCDVLTP